MCDLVRRNVYLFVKFLCITTNRRTPSFRPQPGWPSYYTFHEGPTTLSTCQRARGGLLFALTAECVPWVCPVATVRPTPETKEVSILQLAPQTHYTQLSDYTRTNKHTHNYTNKMRSTNLERDFVVCRKGLTHFFFWIPVVAGVVTQPNELYRLLPACAIQINVKSMQTVGLHRTENSTSNTMDSSSDNDYRRWPQHIAVSLCAPDCMLINPV